MFFTGYNMLIKSYRHKPEDLELWEGYEVADLYYYETHKMQSKVDRAIKELTEFTKTSCYLGVSWGKDSVVAAHLAVTALCKTPLVWVRVEPIKNPDCLLVRDEFLRLFPSVLYDEVVVNCNVDRFGAHAKGTLEAGFKSVYAKYGNRHISGVRSEESGIRKISRFTHGVSTERTCRPIIDWKQNDVFAYLAHFDLPVHPVYAMLGGGRWEREHIRVASLGGKRGDQFGRTVWEKEYYPDILKMTGQF
jgi:phosphoadenosine phosphosulfate reductase